MKIKISDKNLQRLILKEKDLQGKFNVTTFVKIKSPNKKPKLSFCFEIKKIKEINKK